MEPTSVVIVGTGVTGLSAAVECASHGISVTCIEESTLPGGAIGNVGAIAGYPGIHPLSGAELAASLMDRARADGAEFLTSRVTQVLSHQGGLQVQTEDGNHACKVIIVASGAQLRQLGVPGEAELAGKGVSQCDWCDAGFFRNEDVSVIGSGDAALQAALHLARTSRSVSIVVRGEQLRARAAYISAAADQERISFIWNSQVEGIVGDERVESIKLRDNLDHSVMDHSTSGVFVFIGSDPVTHFLPADVKRTTDGFLLTDESFRTSMPGVFAAGAVRSGYCGQIIAACGEGVAAAHAAIRAVQVG